MKKIKIIKIIIYILWLVVLYSSIFINVKFENISFEQLLYTITTSEGANFDIVLVGAIYVIIGLFITTGAVFLLYKLYKKIVIKTCHKIGYKKEIKKFYIFEENNLISFICLIVFIIFTSYGSYKALNIDKYIYSQIKSSKIFEERYVDSRNIELEFPNKKRNLIYIYLESMEMSNASKENGGVVEESYIPKLEKIALENINFSNTARLGGAIQIYNTGWTTAALVAQTAGIPFKLSIATNSYKNYNNFFKGVYSLGDILKDNGYNNYFMIGSDASFGARKGYFEQHGDYKIYDYKFAKNNRLIESNYFVWWGYEDKKLFEFAQQQISQAAKEDEPFNFTLLTVDTHFMDGFMDNSCEEKFDTKYANAIYCSDSKIDSFINWIKEQDFYKNTTIIISGDHLTMQKDFYKNVDEYTRTTYNAFINSAIEPINEKNRLFSTMDMFPTTLAALGVKIPGDMLGLGVNLFSDKKTLLEEMGFDNLNSELAKKSFFYDNVLLGDVYYEVQKENAKK